MIPWSFFGLADIYLQHYYVDSVGGSDSNDGASPATAWQNLSMVQAVSLLQFSHIHLAKGSVWSGVAATINKDVSDTKISSYGAGALPKIDGRKTMATGSMAKTAGRTNVYEYSYTALNNGAEQHNIWENGVRLTRIDFTTDLATTLGLVDSTPGSYYVPVESAFVAGNPILFYFHSSDNSSPLTSGKTYSTQGVQWAIQLGSTTSLNCKVYDVEVMGGSHHNGNIVLGRSSYANNVISRWGTIHATYSDSGFFVNCVSYDCEQGFDFVANSGSVSNGFIEMNGCVADVDLTTGNIQGPGFFVHGTTMATIRYVNCTSRKHVIGFGINGIGQNGQVVYISGCRATCPTDANQFHAFDVNTGDNGGVFTSSITVTDCSSDGFGMFFWGYNLNLQTTITINKARGVIRGNQPAIQIRNGAGMEVAYSSFYGATGAYSGIELTVDGTACYCHHSIFDNFASAGATEQFNNTVWTATNNLYYRASQWRIAGTYYASLAAYKAGVSPQDANAVVGDPLWVEDPSLNGNFAVQGGSPANTLTAGWSNGP